MQNRTDFCTRVSVRDLQRFPLKVCWICNKRDVWEIKFMWTDVDGNFNDKAKQSLLTIAWYRTVYHPDCFIGIHVAYVIRSPLFFFDISMRARIFFNGSAEPTLQQLRLRSRALGNGTCSSRKNVNCTKKSKTPYCSTVVVNFIPVRVPYKRLTSCKSTAKSLNKKRWGILLE